MCIWEFLQQNSAILASDRNDKHTWSLLIGVPILAAKREWIASFQIFDTETEYLLYKHSGHIDSVGSEIQDPDKNKNSESLKHHVELNLEETELDKQEKEQLRSLVAKYSDCFVNPTDGKLGLTDLMECKIKTLPGTMPVCKYPYCLAPAMRDEMDKILKDQVKKGLIEESTEGSWASPALLVKKSSNRFWLVIDYRGLNAATIPQNLRTPRIDEVFNTIGKNQPKFFSVLDCTQGFH